MTRSVVNMSLYRPGRRAKASLAGMLTALLLSGCASFSPDGGMTTVAGIVGETIKKDVVAVRSTDDAQWASERVRRWPRLTWCRKDFRRTRRFRFPASRETA